MAHAEPAAVQGGGHGGLLLTRCSAASGPRTLQGLTAVTGMARYRDSLRSQEWHATGTHCGHRNGTLQEWHATGTHCGHRNGTLQGLTAVTGMAREAVPPLLLCTLGLLVLACVPHALLDPRACVLHSAHAHARVHLHVRSCHAGCPRTTQGPLAVWPPRCVRAPSRQCRECWPGSEGC